MQRNELIELIITLTFLFLVVFTCDPMLSFIPIGMQKGLVLIMIVVFGLFAGTVWHERPKDEREAQHAHLAGRVGYLAGILVLVAGITYQVFMTSVDMWLPVALLAMVAGKLIARLYLRNYC
jgi:hypothetical protein